MRIKKKRLSKGQKAYLEEILFSRSEIEARIETLKDQILYGQPHRELTPGQGYISDPTARKAVELSTNRWLVKSQGELEAIDRALSRLDERHHKLYKLKYCHGERSWGRIAYDMHYDVRHCYRLRDDILWEIATEMGMVG